MGRGGGKKSRKRGLTALDMQFYQELAYLSSKPCYLDLLKKCPGPLEVRAKNNVNCKVRAKRENSKITNIKLDVYTKSASEARRTRKLLVKNDFLAFLLATKPSTSFWPLLRAKQSSIARDCDRDSKAASRGAIGSMTRFH